MLSSHSDYDGVSDFQLQGGLSICIKREKIMKWIETKVIFDFDDKPLASDLISNIFYDMGLQGVVVETRAIEPAVDWAEDAPKTSDDDAVTGYFPKNDSAGKKIRALEQGLAHLKKENRIITRVISREMDEEDWSESWKEYFWPEKISENFVVKPRWREYHPSEDEIVIEIDPGMAFGTGTHPTTALCIQMIERYLKPEATFLDVGTGSGILMIAAANLGAEPVWGVDTDEVAVEIAQKNLLLNRIDASKFRVMTGNLADAVDRRFDLVAANILSEVILVLLDTVQNVLTKGGVFICSGIIERNKDAVVRKMEDSGFEIMRIEIKEKWVSIVGRLS